MHRLRTILATGSLALGLTTLAACGGTTEPTATLAPVSTAVPTAAARPSTAPSAVASTAPSATVATRTTSAATATTSATATRAATSSIATATRAGSPVASPTRTATAGAVLPPQAVTMLQQLGNSRQAWAFSGFSVAGLSGDLNPIFEYNGGNQKVTLSTNGTNLEAYQVGGQLYVNTPIVGVVQADSSNPLATPARTLFATPTALLTALLPTGATYTPGTTESINGRTAMRYTATVNISDLGMVDPSLAGQSGTAATTAWVDTTQGYLVALTANITSATANTTATAHLDVTNVGQTPAITVPR
jgi:hypothetical protein